MAESMTSVRRLHAAERAKQALELRKGGASFAEIARALGYSAASGAYQAVMAALHKMLKEPAEEVRTLELARLDAMLLALWPQVRQGNQGAIEKALKVGERRAKLLGLDAPTKVAPTDASGLDLEIAFERRASQMSDQELEAAIEFLHQVSQCVADAPASERADVPKLVSRALAQDPVGS